MTYHMAMHAKQLPVCSSCHKERIVLRSLEEMTLYRLAPLRMNIPYIMNQNGNEQLWRDELPLPYQSSNQHYQRNLIQAERLLTALPLPLSSKTLLPS